MKKYISLVLIAAFLILSIYFLDADAILAEIKLLAFNPTFIAFILISYFLAFFARAIVWKLYLDNKVSLQTCMYGLFYSLLINHLMPVKVGDLARIGILKAREAKITSQEAINSVLVLRMLDTAVLFSMALSGLVILDLPVNTGMLAGVSVAGLVLAAILLKRYRAFFNRQLQMMKQGFAGKHGLMIILLTIISWALEAGVIYGVLISNGLNFEFLKAIWINSITVAGQIFQITPGGIASYEAIMVFALGAVGVSGENAYSAAIITHGLKFLFAFVVGGLTVAAYPVPLHILKKWIKERNN